MPRSLKLYLNDILECIDWIEKFSKGLTFEDFFDDRKTQDAIIRNLLVIGEATKNLPKEIKVKHTFDWKAVAGFRDILIHQYAGVSFRIVWDVIMNELPVLKQVIQTILKEQ